MTNVMQQFFAECFALNVRVLDMKYDDFNHLVVDGLILYQEVLTSVLPSSVIFLGVNLGSLYR